MMMKGFTCCVVLGMSAFLHVAYAIIGTCNGEASSADLLNCALDATIVDPCPASVVKRNKTLEKFCSRVEDAQPTTRENLENFDFFVSAFKRSFKNNFHSATGANASLMAKSKRTDGFVLWFHVREYDRCRYIDARNATNFQDALTISYDCMYFESMEIGYPFTLTVTELPSQIQRTLTCTVPNHSNLNPVTINDWKSMICFELLRGEEKMANVWFQTAPNKFGNFSYNVSLHKDGEVWRNRVLFPTTQFEQSPVEKVGFDNLPPGNYSVEISPLHSDCQTGCLGSSSWTFEISEQPPPPGLPIIHFILLAVGLILASVVLIVVVACLRRKPQLPGHTSLHLVYVWDRPSHFELIQKFAELLTELGFNVSFDNWEVHGKDPSKWARECVVQAEFIVIVWSDVAIRRYSNTVTDSEVRYEPTYLTSHLFKPILEYVHNRINISCKMYNNPHPPNSVCNIVWDSPMKSNIPDMFKYLPTFVLPKKFSKLLRYLNSDPMYNFPCEPCLPEENLQNYKEYTKFRDLLQNYKKLRAKSQCSDRVNEFEGLEENSQPQLLINCGYNADLESVTDQGYASLSTDANGSIQPVYPSLPVNESVSVQPVYDSLPADKNTGSQCNDQSLPSADVEHGSRTESPCSDDDILSWRDRTYLDNLLNET